MTSFTQLRRDTTIYNQACKFHQCRLICPLRLVHQVTTPYRSALYSMNYLHNMNYLRIFCVIGLGNYHPSDG